MSQKGLKAKEVKWMDDMVSRRDVLRICGTLIWNGMDDYRSISAREIAEEVKKLPSISPCESCRFTYFEKEEGETE